MVDSALPDNWSRVQLVWVKPQIECGQWPIKRAQHEDVEVTAAILVDGHQEVGAELVYQREGEEHQTVRMTHQQNDEYAASFPVSELGRYRYWVHAWLDEFRTWYEQFERRVEGGDTEYEIKSELLVGASLLENAAEEATSLDQDRLAEYAERLRNGDIETALDEQVWNLAAKYDPRPGLVTSDPLEVWVDPVEARYSAWYEFFPRSAGDRPDQHATLDDAAERLPRIKELGFDVVYLPPIHPIGETNRKGKDNAPEAKPGDPGSPWAIGNTEGGHKAVHPELGGMEAFRRFVDRADELDLKVALDIAFQTSPDHPYVDSHPEWFEQRPDGTIRYAENPPKKYQDVHPLDFENEHWRALWREARSIFEFWIERGVKIFRVDNPHTKPYAFWKWCLGSLREEYPDTIYLAEAFSRPKVMQRLAKLGFNQSYTYFTWRNSKSELESYCQELFETDVAEYFRPNFFPNTPDILHEYLVDGGRPAHVIRFILAATLSSTYGLYGPPYEHVDNNQHPDREEYANNEKYEIRTWNWNDPQSLQPTIKRVNRIRANNPALHYMRNLELHTVDNDQILAYSKQTEDNLILVVITLDPYHPQEGTVHLPLDELGLPEDRPYQVHDLFGGEHYFWNGPSNYVRLDPHSLPAHIFEIQRKPTTETSFPYFM